MKKKTFVPSVDHLESRIALSGGAKFFHHHGAVPVLTTHALDETYQAIHSAFTSFATTTPLNYNLLSFDLGKAVNRIPYNVRDGLVATVQAEVPVLHDSISGHDSGHGNHDHGSHGNHGKGGHGNHDHGNHGHKSDTPVIDSYHATIADVNAFVAEEVAAGIFVLA